MPTPPNSTVLRPAGKIAAFLFIAAALMVALGAWHLGTNERRWLGYFFVSFGALNLFGGIQHFTSKITLLPDRLEFGSLFGRTAILKDEIQSVTAKPGTGISLRTRTQKSVRIPDLGRAQAICDAVRAWLKS